MGRAVYILGFLLLLDLVIIWLHIRYGLAVFSGKQTPFLKISVDGSLGELFGYAKFLLAACLCLAVSRRPGNAIFLALGAVLLVMLLDDTLRLHERLGDALEHGLGLSAALGLRGQDFGELLYGFAVGVPTVVFTVMAWQRTKTAYRQDAAITIGLIGVFLFFAVVVDVVHSFVSSARPGWSAELGLIEDGGELLVLSLLVAFVFHVWNSRQTSSELGSP